STPSWRYCRPRWTRKACRSRRRTSCWLGWRRCIATSSTCTERPCGPLTRMPGVKAPLAEPMLFKNAKSLETWLKKHHASSDGLWLQIAKKGADEASVTYPEAIEIALCWGWIDGQKKGLDDQHFL